MFMSGCVCVWYTKISKMPMKTIANMLLMFLYTSGNRCFWHPVKAILHVSLLLFLFWKFHCWSINDRENVSCLDNKSVSMSLQLVALSIPFCWFSVLFPFLFIEMAIYRFYYHKFSHHESNSYSETNFRINLNE